MNNQSHEAKALTFRQTEITAVVRAARAETEVGVLLLT